MTSFNRRDFLRGGAAAVALATGISRLQANPLGLPIGLQLYTVRVQLAKDFKGTLAQVAAVGYQEVEITPFYHQKPAELKQTIEAAGLKAPSGHCGAEQLTGDVGAVIASFREAGLQYMVCSFPASRPGKAQPTFAVGGTPHEPSFDTDDYKWLANLFNQTGAKCQQAGIQFAYHAHNLDFKVFDDQPALDQLMHDTDPKAVQLELDCYWAARAARIP